MSLAYINGKYVEIEDVPVYEEFQETIEDLERKLDSTDYKIIKAAEYNLVDLDKPYDIQALHAERQTLRDKINALKEQAKMI